jgi:hypothetical protein
VVCKARVLMAAPAALRIAGFFPWTGDWSGGRSIERAVALALADIDADPSILPHTRLSMPCVWPNASDCPQPNFTDTRCLAEYGESKLFDPLFTADDPGAPPLVGLLGAGCTAVCLAMQAFVNAWQVPMLSYGCTSAVLNDVTAYPFFLRAAPDVRRRRAPYTFPTSPLLSAPPPPV